VAVADAGVFCVAMFTVSPVSDTVPKSLVSVVDDVPMTVLFAPIPIADDPITIELLSLLFRPRDPAPK
jgi:hypothetical protein